ncbi:MAG: NADPH-dependent F420 reductase [Alphaproteobacteria bacterium]|nr:MAG: NADPH-dependent F420 reductase [Alphaproteobacteria bacterium]
MNIAILGTGAMGQNLAARLAASGYTVVLGSRDPSSAKKIAGGIDAGVQSASIRGAAQSADVIVLAVPFDAARDTLRGAGDVSGKIVIDIINPMKADFSGLTIGRNKSAAEFIQAGFPEARVVKALNTVFAPLILEPTINGSPVTAFYAGDDADANSTVRAILERAGFKPEFAGPLKNARYLEPLAALNITFGYGLGGGVNIAPEWRRAA